MSRNVSHLSLIFIICLFHHHAVTQKCHTTTVNDGICIPVRDCNSIVHQLIRANISETLKQEIRESQCEYRNGSPYVCCDLDTLYPYRAIVDRFANSNVKESTKLGNLFPTSDKCGIDLSSAIYRTNDVGMYEHPGMVLLKYEYEQIGCGGTLINHRYVLTAASCVSGDIVQKLGKIKSVRLGEHDLDTDPECDYSDLCHHYVETEVAEIVVSKDFIANEQHDLALIRLANDVDTIKYQPLCIQPQAIDLYRNSLRVVGWGITFDRKTSTERKYLAMDYVNKTECYDTIEAREISVSHLPAYVICAKRQTLTQKSVCPLDGGGVLVARSNDYQWTIIGLASYRPSCGVDKLSPIIFTDISHHLDWIQYNMRP